MGIRDFINKVCKKHDATSNVVVSVELICFNIKKRNIIIAILPFYDIQYLQNNLNIWESIIPSHFLYIFINNNWNEIAIHRISLYLYYGISILDLIKNGLMEFNQLDIIGEPV